MSVYVIIVFLCVAVHLAANGPREVFSGLATVGVTS